MSKSFTQLRIDDSTIESMKRLGEQFSSIALVAAPNSHLYVDKCKGIQDRLTSRGTFDIDIIMGYDLTVKRIKVVNGQVQIKTKDGTKKWVDIITGMPEFKELISRSSERESWKNIALASMEDKLALATAIEASRKASKRAKKKHLEKLEKALGIVATDHTTTEELDNDIEE